MGDKLRWAFARPTSSSEQLLEVVSRWVQTLYGNGNLQDALDGVRNVLSADHVLISRCNKSGAPPKSVARSQDDFPGRPMVDLVLGRDLWTCRQGATWFVTDLDDSAECDIRLLNEAIGERGATDVLILALDVGDSVADFLEISTRSQFDREQCASLCETLAKAWLTRPPGLAEMSSYKNRKIETADDHREFPTGVLEPSNPAKLSRCEFRVCSMIRVGLSAKAIAEELSVQESTVRSHLRSIYSKTNVSGQLELLHRLSLAADSGDQSRVVA